MGWFYSIDLVVPVVRTNTVDVVISPSNHSLTLTRDMAVSLGGEELANKLGFTNVMAELRIKDQWLSKYDAFGESDTVPLDTFIDAWIATIGGWENVFDMEKDALAVFGAFMYIHRTVSDVAVRFLCDVHI